MSNNTKTTVYCGHTIEKRGDADLTATMRNLGFAGDMVWIAGPICNGGTSGGIAAGKKMIDEALRRYACKAATGHGRVVVRGAQKVCVDCGAFVEGARDYAGYGASFCNYRRARNGHVYGWSRTRDFRGKWYARDEGRTRVRLVRCATRAKAKAKATEWWIKAEAGRG